MRNDTGAYGEAYDGLDGGSHRLGGGGISRIGKVTSAWQDGTRVDD